MMNYPHNPSGQIATAEWLEALCRHCAANDIRLFNDAAYICLAHGEESVTLAQIAPDHPELSWAEAYTAAKLIGNGTGWHVGALVGSPDFIADIAEVKGKTDAGLVAPMAAGVVAALEEDQAGIAEYRATYRRRLKVLSRLLTDCGMRLAIRPRAGFYTLWETPTHAFGREIAGAEDFNLAMIEETGVVGVNFASWLRYAVCADVEAMADDLGAAFRRPRYHTIERRFSRRRRGDGERPRSGFPASGGIVRSSASPAGWRMGWDSNPRGARTPAGFQDRCIRPLCHPSLSPDVAGHG